jgi:hypothetical protein
VSAGKIELRGEEPSAQHVLDDVPLTEGSPIRVRMADGTWLEGTYTWSGNMARWPGLRIALGGPVPEGSTRRPVAVMALPPQADVRHAPAADQEKVDQRPLRVGRSV